MPFLRLFLLNFFTEGRTAVRPYVNNHKNAYFLP